MTRAERLRQVQRPYLIAFSVLVVGALAAFALGPKGQVNWPGTLLLALAPVVDARRHRAAFKYHDEYGQSVILRAAAVGFTGVMGSLLGLALLSAAEASADFASGTMVGVFVAGYAVFLVTQWVLFRRDAQA
ncbi:hypothetical protein SAMN04488058_111106 [Deinococcus reticulitermitis]|uniref:Uncharacterized protein n=1 Tax=Deinococcus reticulitermitis TaxID=856736 RepID=A0A1H7A2F8_9DEIO|nr:hypothetical protein [Deinococcus reticulitermitis]SEJ59869.1 hypothetical protein SAMN04488058_111106 [Deinococcus reticulitermitis]